MAVKKKEVEFYDYLLWQGNEFAYKCKSGNEYSAKTKLTKIDVKTKEDYFELKNNAFLKDFLFNLK